VVNAVTAKIAAAAAASGTGSAASLTGSGVGMGGSYAGPVGGGGYVGPGGGGGGYGMQGMGNPAFGDPRRRSEKGLLEKAGEVGCVCYFFRGGEGKGVVWVWFCCEGCLCVWWAGVCMRGILVRNGPRHGWEKEGHIPRDDHIHTTPPKPYR
jgi:hypothetical protein